MTLGNFGVVHPRVGRGPDLLSAELEKSVVCRSPIPIQTWTDFRPIRLLLFCLRFHVGILSGYKTYLWGAIFCCK